MFKFVEKDSSGATEGFLIMFKPEHESVKCFFIDQHNERLCRKYLFRDYFYVMEPVFLGYANDHRIDFQYKDMIDLDAEFSKDGPGSSSVTCFKVFYPQSCRSKTRFLQDIQKNFTCHWHNVPLAKKIAIDMHLHVGCWYKFFPDRVVRLEKTDTVELNYVVFDLEVSKKPFCFPVAEKDAIMSVAALSNASAVVLVNEEFYGHFEQRNAAYANEKFKQYNKLFSIRRCPSEKHLLQQFVNILSAEQPELWITYNGECFDMPYLAKRCEIQEVDFKQFGFRQFADQYVSYTRIHLDVFKWVERDSYLPKGCRSLKKACSMKLKFDPEEIEPELMMQTALRDPMKMIMYNISDTMTTKMLSDTFVLPYMFALGKVACLNVDDLLRKGSGAICDVCILENYVSNNICVKSMPSEKSTHVVDDVYVCKNATYVGGYVECNAIGVHHNKHVQKMPFDASFVESLKESVSDILMYNLDIENIRVASVLNLNETVSSLKKCLVEYTEWMEENDCQDECNVYHFDVNAMYPNIILHYRLQPHAVRLRPCCDFCLQLQWTKKLEVWDISVETYNDIRGRVWNDGVDCKQNMKCVEKEVSAFLRGQRKRVKNAAVEIPTEVWMCQKAMPVFLDNVSAFKSMRYEFKNLLKKENKSPCRDTDRINFLDNMQLAYKCVLNSFYGWLKMPGNRYGTNSEITAALICECARNIIQQSDRWLDAFCLRINTDTDGTYRKVPKHFPVNVALKLNNGSQCSLNFINCILNYNVKNHFRNDKYVENGIQKDRCFIVFEADGPYKMSYLPANLKGESVKKKYVVYNFDNTVASIKGCEVIRCNEFNFVKEFQKEFIQLLSVTEEVTLEKFYSAVYDEVVQKYDLFFRTRGKNVEDGQVLHFLKKEQAPSKPVDQYVSTTPINEVIRKIAEVMQDDSLLVSKPKCSYIVLKHPAVPQVAKRAVPTLLFENDSVVIDQFIRKWTGVAYTRLSELIDWEYYEKKWNDCRSRFYSHPKNVQLKTSDKSPRKRMKQSTLQFVKQTTKKPKLL